jgi:predicted Zn-dependent protease with MMP-like domain
MRTMQISEHEFEQLVAEAMDSIPPKYQSRLNNIAFVIENEPTADQRARLKLRGRQSLYGLYEGIPLTSRGSNYNLVLPDKITIFKKPIEESSHAIDALRDQIRRTVWHEVAHYFGLDHDRIFKLENNP